MSNPFDFSQFTSNTKPPAAGDGGTRAEDAMGSGPGGQRSSAVESSFGPEPSGVGVAAPPAPTGAPIWWIVAGVAIALVAAGVALLFPASPIILCVAWFAAGPVAIACFAAYSLADTRRRASIYYSASPKVVWLYRIGILVTFASIFICAIQLALWVGRL